MTQAWRRLSWAIPPLFCLIFYWYGLTCWFRQDDFAWLKLRSEVHTWPDFWRVLILPRAQGTIRPFSERLYFIGLYSLFGLDALPFRICALVVQFANLTLIRSVTARITGSDTAGFWAALLWIANGALITVMTWSAVFNQALCGFFLLLAFYFLLRFIETGQQRFNAAQWIVFLLGFGALELNVMYPALACAYTFFCARSYFRGALPLLVPSVVYAVFHRIMTHEITAKAYVMQFDSKIFRTFWKYLFWARGVDHDPRGVQPVWLWKVCTILILAGLMGFLIAQTRKGRNQGLFFAAWFVILLLPVLPLSLHLSEYYLTLPVIGLAMLGGWAVASAWRSVIAWKTVASLLLVIYLIPLPALYAETKSRYQLTRQIERVVRGVEAAHQLHSGQIILLSEVSDELFWNGIFDRPFPLVGVSDVYLTPDTESNVKPHPAMGTVTEFILPAAATLDGLRRGNVEVYSVAGDRLKNVTAKYESMSDSLQRETPRRVDVANDLLAYLLGPTWYQNDKTHRWMPKRATVRLGGPRNASERLYLTGYCVPQVFQQGPLPVRVEVDGAAFSPVTIQTGANRFDFDFALPAGSIGKESIEVAVEVGRTFSMPGEDRQLGIAFGIFEIR